MLKRTLPALAGIVCLLSATHAHATYQLQVDWNGTYHASNAGEFKITFFNLAYEPNANGGLGLGNYDLSNYAASTGNYGSGGLLQSYATFCVERGQTVNVGTKYNYDGITSAVVPGQKPIAQGTAYLYEQFATGSLEGYNYANDPSGSRKNDAAALQNAIWTLEDASGAPGANDPAWKFLGLVVERFGSLEAARQAYDGNAVGVLSSATRQDFLILIGQTPVPEPATMLAWGCVAAVGGLVYRRRLKHSVV